MRLCTAPLFLSDFLRVFFAFLFILILNCIHKETITFSYECATVGYLSNEFGVYFSFNVMQAFVWNRSEYQSSLISEINAALSLRTKFSKQCFPLCIAHTYFVMFFAHLSRFMFRHEYSHLVQRLHGSTAERRYAITINKSCTIVLFRVVCECCAVCCSVELRISFFVFFFGQTNVMECGNKWIYLHKFHRLFAYFRVSIVFAKKYIEVNIGKEILILIFFLAENYFRRHFGKKLRISFFDEICYSVTTTTQIRKEH